MRTQQCLNHLVAFTSSDTAVAAVDEKTGLVHGVSEGTVTITAAATYLSTQTASITLIVRSPRILTLPQGLTQIESSAFADLPAADAVRIPASVTSIAPDAFDSSLTLLVPAGSPWVQWAEANGYHVAEE